ncbi:alpha/beta hydrolase [Phycicoccus sp. CSK15P-2]|uniref:poly(ethylene terephthalate) hydrolase family protein n=1 Tax=Phycicoccus sp. CSK15P-2 TaxID=2807627 RepID=UPI00194F81D2|nr:alpha/beta hydrolase [Phycicoccus sp. CSK15P-2]MBM6405312.1 alpha/beta hydrolase [Phycicoccus sp. CSK15P-2]
MKRIPARTHLTRRLAAAVLAGGLLVSAPAAAQADSPYERGPDPTERSIEATRGPFSVSTISVSDFSTPGFGAANITYPTSRSEGTFGVVAISPGYTAGESTIAWLRPRIASQGFVVISFDTNSRTDFPSSRGDQLLAALDYVIEDSSVRDRVDGSRQAVMGHSMGGGGSLEAASDRRSIEAVVGLTPWNSDKTWSEVDAASLMIGAENDSVAPARTHAIPFYNSLTGAEDRAYLELDGASHLAPTFSNTEIAKYSISWLKRFVDDDDRYDQFLCPAPSTGFGSPLSDSRVSCPLG